MSKFATNMWDQLGVNYTQPTSTTSTGTTDPSWWDKAMGYTNDEGANVSGWAPQTINGINGLAQSWLAFQNYGLAKEQFGFQKKYANMNFDQQTKMLNNDLYKQYMNHQALAPDRFTQSPEEYMASRGLTNSQGTNMWMDQQQPPTPTVSANTPNTNNNQNVNPMSAFRGLA